MPAPPTAAPDPRRVYEERRAARRAAHADAGRRHHATGTARLTLLGIAAALGAGIVGGAGYSGWWLLAPLAGVAALGGRLDRIEAERRRLERAIAFHDHGLARLDDAWAGAGEHGGDFADSQHLYAADLDLFGPGSVFERLCAARTQRGRATLAGWLLSPAAPEVVRARQAAVDELAGNLDLREDLAVAGRDTQAAVDAPGLAAWGAASPTFDAPALLAAGRTASAAGALALAAGVAWVLAAGGSLEIGDGLRSALGWYFVAAVAGVALVQRRIRPAAARVFRGLDGAAGAVAQLGDLLARLEAERFRAPHLAPLRARLDVDGAPPSRQAARLTRLAEWGDSRHNRFARLLGFFLVQDVHLAYAVERWRLASGPHLGAWIDTVGEIEALASLAGYRFERPGDVWPELADGPARFEADGLAHPLLPAGAAANDVRLGKRPQVVLVSGSNMSGKSTLLRAVGVAAVLAQAGAPVRARRLRMSPLAVGASIRITDSLRGGSSRFHAEIVRLRAILARTERTEDEAISSAEPAARRAGGAAAAPVQDEDGGRTPAAPVLFLIDECLHGTNSHDRRIGAEAVVRGLVQGGAVGLVTTHDLALTAIVDALSPRAANAHFTDDLADGRLRFDYTLRPGVVGRGNALALMRAVGFDI